MAYDAVIAGASFAGLAVAAQLRGRRVLVLDRKAIGSGQTSACGTLVSTLRALGLEGAMCQMHGRLVVHSDDRERAYRLSEPYCTFDYARLCHLLWQRCDAEFALTPALGVENGAVRTAEGTVRADVVVDATGWRAGLARSLAPTHSARRHLGFGIETVAPYREDGLHFWHYPTGERAVELGWAFPAGPVGHVGLGSYSGRTTLNDPLDEFLARLGVQRRRVHGGYFPTALRVPVVGNLFVVGDAAGQCLGVTAEGIRPALFFGTRLGRLLRDALEGHTTVAGAQAAYRALVHHRRRSYTVLSALHRLVSALPLPLARGLRFMGGCGPIHRRALPRYQRAFALDACDARADWPIWTVRSGRTSS